MDDAIYQHSLYLTKSVSVSLEDIQLWKQFHQEGTEMIITKSGRRMFPQCKIKVFGLHPYTKYVVLIDFVPLDNFKYKRNKNQWEVSGKAEPTPPIRSYIHPDSPAPGAHWMNNVICFQKLKLTNNTLDQQGHIILHSMHRYKPRFHVIQSDDLYNICRGLVQVFSFQETEFTAVTAYQNEKITKLKIDHNPFAKGFREQENKQKTDNHLKHMSQSTGTQNKRKWENSSKETAQYKVACVNAVPGEVPTRVYAQWVPDQNGSQNLAPMSTTVTQFQNQEHQVSTIVSFSNRSSNRRDLQPRSGLLDSNEAPIKLLKLDVATVPDVATLHSLPPAHDRSNIRNIPVETPGPSLSGAMYNPHGAEPWMVSTQGQYYSMSYSYLAELGTQEAAAQTHNSMSEWSQRSLFPYTGW